ncbi:unnamed protein product [Arabidopsis lyrata]|nr:unnamed protein product [Arabidopsis lyrata]
MGEDMRGEKVVSKWPPIIVMLISQVAMGSVNALVKKALDVGVNHMIVGAYRMAISSFILAPIAYILERFSRFFVDAAINFPLPLRHLRRGTLSIKYPCKFSSTCLMSIFAAFQCALLSLYKSRDVKDWIIDDRFVIGVIVYAGVIGQAMSTVSVTWGVKQLGAVFVSAIMPIALISATLFDFLILHTPLYLGSLIGSVGPIIGLYVFLWGKNKEMEA